MSYSALEAQVIKFENDRKKRITIERFARTVGVLMVILGTLTIGYGSLIMFWASTEEAALINIPVISDMWECAYTIEGSPIGMIIVCAVATALIPALLTGIFAIAVYCIPKKIQPAHEELTLKSAAVLLDRSARADGHIVFSNTVPNAAFFLCAFAMFFLSEYQIAGASGVHILTAVVEGLKYAVILFVVFLFIRGLFILVSRVAWRKRSEKQRDQLNDQLITIIREFELKGE